MKQLFFLLLAGFCFAGISAQNTNCTVQLDSLKGTYEGDCSSGKANGFGKAKGADSYEGNFKNGYPEGQGTYTWKNGNYYKGGWKKGLKDGKGEMHLYINNRDSMITGFWKKDVYKGEYEHPYVVITNTTDVGRIQATKVDRKGNTITLSVESLAGGGSIYGSGAKASVTLTGNQVIRGSYLTKTQNTLGNKDVNVFRSVTFPFRAIFTMGGSSVEIEIFEEGNWDIIIPINK